MCRAIAIVLLLLCGLSVSPHARAAQSYDNCNNFIDSLPTVITTQGVWCLRKDLATNINSGTAITIAANNVTIDCNDFKLGGLAAGSSSNAWGIGTLIDWSSLTTTDVQNITIRHCSVRGFNTGIMIFGGYGHLIEDNRLDNNLVYGIRLDIENPQHDYGSIRGIVRRNRVLDTGGYAAGDSANGIYAYADIEDNLVDGVLATNSGGAYALNGLGDGSEIRGNTVRNVSGGSVNYGIISNAYKAHAHGNHVYSGSASGTYDTGVYASSASMCDDNLVSGFTTAYQYCTDGGNNRSL